MATRTANKGSLRAAASARRTKHAQRTPLPGDTSQPVKGNPTAEIIKDELAKSKPRKKSTASRKAAAPAPEPSRDSRTFGSQTADLAAQVREMRDAGALWRTIAEELGLGEGKTGTGRARRLYRSTGNVAPRRRASKPQQPRTVRVLAEDGSVTREEVSGDGGVPMQREVVSFHLHCKDERRGVKTGNRMKDVHVAPVGEQQVRSLSAIFEGDGYTVTTERHVAGTECCTGSPVTKASPRPKAAPARRRQARPAGGDGPKALRDLMAF
jgi:hypothetical protein